ncbi:MAG: zinc-binding dehydrogenase, partial [Pseudomonadales bacterium]|nr:zinc-binding dehydrogenase [Pseudomonadales bacterium]
AGQLTPVLAEKQFTLEEAGKAHEYAENGSGMGKVVINVSQ